MSTIVPYAPLARDKRALDRVPTFLEAQLLTATGRSVECVVWDMTKKGAKIGIDHEIALPLFFDLYVTDQKLMLRCEGRWRTAEFVGVRFHSKEDSPASPTA